MLARRFMAKNKLRPQEFWAIFARDSQRTSGAIWHEFDYEAFAPYVGHSSESILYTFPDRWEFDPNRPVQRVTRYCPECATVGYHSVFHEVSWLANCVIHGVPLLNRCSTCRRDVSQLPPRVWGAGPKMFPCGHEWTRADLHSPERPDLRAMWLLADWLLRVSSRNSEERWYAVALGPSDSLDSLYAGYSPIADLVTTLPPLPQGIRRAVKTLWSETEMRMLSGEALPADWFKQSIRRLKSCKRDDPSGLSPSAIYLIRQLFAQDWLEQASSEAFRAGIRKSIRVVDLSTRLQITPCWPNSVIDLISAVFLKKLNIWSTRRDYSTEHFIMSESREFRFSAQPLGLLRRTRRNDELYWVPTTRYNQHELQWNWLYRLTRYPAPDPLDQWIA